MAIAHVATATSKTANNQTNTSLSVALGSTTIGDFNVIEIVGMVTGTGINNGFTTPAGWTKLGESFDSGTTSSETTAIFYRFFQSGDPSSVTVAWTNAGQAAAISSGYSGVDTTTPIPVSQIEPKGTTDATYSVSLTVSASGWIRSGFGNRSGDVPGSLADTSRGSTFNASAATIVAQDTAADATAGTYTKTALGTNTTSIGSEWAYQLNPSGSGSSPILWTVDEGLSLGEPIATSLLATVDTYSDAMGLTDSVVRNLNTGPTSTPRILDFTFGVELAPGYGPRSAAPVYVDISDYVSLGAGDVLLSRGREDESSTDAQPGRANFNVDNPGGAFTLGNDASPLAPVRLRTPLRWSVSFDNIRYTLWQGFTDGAPTYMDGTLPRARMSASDRIARLGKTKLGRIAEDELRADSPDMLYFLRDLTADAAATAEPVLVVKDSITPGGTAAFTGSEGPGLNEDPTLELVRASTTSGKYLRAVRTVVPTAAFAWTQEALVKPTALGAQVIIGSALLDGTGVEYAVGQVVGIDSQGRLSFSLGQQSVHPLTAGEWNHVAVTYDNSIGRISFYINGVLDFTTTGFFSAGQLHPETLTVGGYFDYAVATGWAPFDGSIAWVATYPTVLSAARIAAHASAAFGYAGDTSTARYQRIAKAAGVPAGMVTVAEARTTPLIGQKTLDRSALDIINEVSPVDGAFVFVDTDGLLVYAPASARYNTPVGLTLDATKPGHVLLGSEVQYDDALLVNDVTATGGDGTIVRVTDATSIDEYDPHELTITLPTASSDAPYTVATWILATRSQPEGRIDGIEIDVVGYYQAGGDVPALLNADIGTRLIVQNIPDEMVTSTSIDTFIEGVKHRISKTGWRMSFTTSPRGIYGRIAVLDSPTTGRLDAGNILGL